MFGMLATNTREFGSPAASAAIACSNCARNVATGVIALSLDAQTSFAPIRTVTYSTC